MLAGVELIPEQTLHAESIGSPLRGGDHEGGGISGRVPVARDRLSDPGLAGDDSGIPGGAD